MTDRVFDNRSMRLPCRDCQQVKMHVHEPHVDGIAGPTSISNNKTAGQGFPLDKRAGLMGGDVQVPVCFESREGTALSVAVRGT